MTAGAGVAGYGCDRCRTNDISLARREEDMSSRHNLLFMGILILFTLSRCHTPPVLVRTEETRSTCYIVYDAGSSGTRLYIYAQDDAELREHEGPKVSALADPVRELRGKTWNDAEA